MGDLFTEEVFREEDLYLNYPMAYKKIVPDNYREQYV
jgi:hypothetical protein